MFTEQNTLAQLLEVEAAAALFDQIAPGMKESPAYGFMKDLPLEVVMQSAPEKARPAYMLLLDAANGKEVKYEAADPKMVKPELMGDTVMEYNIDDVDGPMYMLEHRFSGSIIIQFTKTMDENAYGRVTYQEQVLPKGLIKGIKAAGGMQMCSIPVRDIFREYDHDYELLLEDFKDTDGNVMEPVTIKVHTLPKPEPDEAYAEHDAVALRAAEEGIVLLKNENNLLPLPKTASIKLRNAEEFRVGAVGAGKINPRYSIGLNRAVADYSDFAVSEDSDTAVIMISRPSGENYDNNATKGNFYLSEKEEEQLKALKAECRHIIAVINSGYPMDVRWLESYQVEAALWCGFPGMCGGKAVVEILDGRVNPSAKLPDTWSLDYWDIPSSRNFFLPESEEQALDAECELYIDTYYEEGIYVGYRYFETFGKEVAYPFGYGLSYTEFEISAVMDHAPDTQKVHVTVKNTGKAAGQEVVQVYVKIPDGKLEQPMLRLVGFAKTKMLEPGSSQKLEIVLERRQLASYDEDRASWIMEPGTYVFYAGDSVKALSACGKLEVAAEEILKETENLMKLPVDMEILSKKSKELPRGGHTGIKEGVSELLPKADRKHYPEEETEAGDFVDTLTVEQLARLSVCASHGWGMHEKGEAGRIYRLEGYNMPAYVVADGNNGVNVNRKNIGMPCSNTVCATWNTDLAYQVGRVIAEEAKDNEIHMILGPAMNIHRNPLNGRHPEYFSEDPFLAGIMAGNQSKGLEDHGVSSCVKHVIGNNCEASRKRNQSLIPERALREIYLKAFEIALSVNQPDSLMTGYNAVNGCFTASDEEMLEGIFRKEFGFKGFVMTDWTSYDTVDVAEAVQAGNTWMTPGSTDDTYVAPIVEGVKSGKIDEKRLKANVRAMLRVVQKRTGADMGVK